MSAGPARVWGPWATIGWTVLCILVLFVIQIGVLLVFVAIGLGSNRAARLEELATSGNVLAFGTLASTPAVVGLVVFLVRVRRYSIRDYLDLSWPPVRKVVVSLASLALVIAASDVTSHLLGRPLVPPVMVNIYKTAWLPAILLTLVVLAPLGEETLFRGFLYKGIVGSRAGPVGAIIVSSVGWALLHAQYDWYGIVSVTLIGFYLGVVRYWTGSILVTMFLHAISNMVATLEIVILEHWLR
jgi:membrane protease YdiL (CAAX protease family)